ncbi:hypothetical protein F503_06570 [Ophiostoma piceae UAMH 11346]|uniref:Duf1479 domain protein n=1 Tax=Ophiostoma piceae (strain UAMH 11346) TaxID=1262450 RepID=S3BMZ8_OPHP1|nr:hypothetical protein F503_06570 [Ophiostoma piceae UAMH 11346]
MMRSTRLLGRASSHVHIPAARLPRLLMSSLGASPLYRPHITRQFRSINIASVACTNSKREGDISDSFASMAGVEEKPLPDRYRELKLSLVEGNEAAIKHGWQRLLAELRNENDILAAQGPAAVPDIQFDSLSEDISKHRETLLKRGVAVIRGVIPEAEARAYKESIEAYAAKNPSTRGFPPENRQVFELYWSAAQLRARSHPNLARVQRELMTTLWHAAPEAEVDLGQPMTYADRLRIRQPGDARFALGPHQDGGSVERWEPKGYGCGHVYDEVFAGQWEDYDAWDAGKRALAIIDMHQGLGACSVFRAFQGWLSISHVAPLEGTLLVYPLAKLSTAYTLLRPFFEPLNTSLAPNSAEFLDASNWTFTSRDNMASTLQGATPGHGQEFPTAKDGTPLHPHLELARAMVHVPAVKPGDFVVWHCDTIHAVDKVHNGTGDSSVLYIPVCPMTEENARYLVTQRDCVLSGVPSPDFPGGKGESEHVDRPDPVVTLTGYGEAALQSMGLGKLVTSSTAPGAAAITAKANKILGF